MSITINKVPLILHIVLGLVYILADYVHSVHTQTNITSSDSLMPAVGESTHLPLIKDAIDLELANGNMLKATPEMNQNPNKRIPLRRTRTKDGNFEKNKSHAAAITDEKINLASVGKKYPNSTSSLMDKKNLRDQNESKRGKQHVLPSQPIKGIVRTDNITKVSLRESESGQFRAKLKYKESDVHYKTQFNETFDKELNQTTIGNAIVLHKQQRSITASNTISPKNNDTRFTKLSRNEKHLLLASVDPIFTKTHSLINSKLTNDTKHVQIQTEFNTEAIFDVVSASMNTLKPLITKSIHLSQESHDQSSNDSKIYLNDERTLVEVAATEEVHLFTPGLINKDENEFQITRSKEVATMSTVATSKAENTSTTTQPIQTSTLSKGINNRKILMNITKYLTTTPGFHHVETTTLFDYELFNITVDFENTSNSEENDTVRIVQEFPWPVKKEAVVEGDIVLGGLMMVHERQEEITCGPVMPQGGIQALEAMLFTLDKVNEWNMLPNITIGAHILDDCDKDTYGLEMAVDFIKGEFIIHATSTSCTIYY